MSDSQGERRAGLRGMGKLGMGDPLPEGQAELRERLGNSRGSFHLATASLLV